jgi:hypothetical protein
MVRSARALPFIVLLAANLHAQTGDETDPRIARALAVQKAMTEARQHLQEKRPADAVALLEAEILYVNGNPNFLALMKDAYVAYLQDLLGKNGAVERVEHARRQLRILDPKLDVNAIAPEKPRGTVARGVPGEDDPFQQVPLDGAGSANPKAEAVAAFAQKRYGDAARLFAQARQTNVALSDEEQRAWAYARLHEVATKLAKADGAALMALEKEADEASRLGGQSLEKFGQSVRDEVRKRKQAAGEPAAIPEGWQAHEAGSFRILFRKSQEQASEIARAAEQARAATFEKWSGPAGRSWSPRCDVWLHASAADYAKTTEKSAASPGHSSVGLRDGRVVVRRIDLRLDDAGFAEVTMPREVAYVVLADLFAEQPLPRWADVGMTVLSGPASEASRYLRAAPRLAQERQLQTVRDLLRAAEFPDAGRITAFYVQSVSLVDYLVRLKGPKAFMLYLREAPRRGYEEALQRHYGIKDANELQERWLKAVAGVE